MIFETTLKRMGQNASAVEQISKQLKKKLPISICFLIHRNITIFFEYVDIIAQIVNDFEVKYQNPRNQYAFLIDQMTFMGQINFCDAKTFALKIKDKKLDKMTSIPEGYYKCNKSDLYNIALELHWRNGIKMLVDINEDTLTNESNNECKSRLLNNYTVDSIDFHSQKELLSILEHISIMNEIRFQDKEVLSQNFTKQSYRDFEIPKKKKVEIMELYKDKLNLEFIKNFQGKIDENDCKKYEATITLDENPFSSDGNEVYCFYGYITTTNPTNGKKETCKKVFKLAKYLELDLECNFAAQSIARFLAKEYSKNLF